jgi:DnaK suppressor protein
MPKSGQNRDKKVRKDFIKKAAETLHDTKKQLLREIQDRVKEETEGRKDEGRDTYDLASDERDREINFILNDREREKLLAIEEALQRIKDNTYGVCECGCENCEGEIQLGRLKILPFTRLCIKCQEEIEKESKLQKKFEDERSYRKLVITDIEEEGF